jgi:peptidoglycan/LPS O-acetylase OafA/YrhL
VTDRPDQVARWLRPAWIPAVACTALVAGAFHLSEASRPLYVGGFALIGVLCASSVGHLVVTPDGATARVLSARPLAWLGKRSYGFYLWHYPILLLASRLVSSTAALALVVVPTVLLVTALSWHVVEAPMLRLKQRRYADPAGRPDGKAVLRGPALPAQPH